MPPKASAETSGHAALRAEPDNRWRGRPTAGPTDADGAAKRPLMRETRAVDSFEYKGYLVELTPDTVWQGDWFAAVFKDGVVTHRQPAMPRDAALDRIKSWVDLWVAIDTGPFPELARPIEEAIQHHVTGWQHVGRDWDLDALATFLVEQAERVQETLAYLNEWAAEQLSRDDEADEDEEVYDEDDVT
jgi:hypothetical protein